MNMTTFREVMTARKSIARRAYFATADGAELFLDGLSSVGKKGYLEQTCNERGFVVYY